VISFPRQYQVALAVPYWNAATYWAILRSVLFGKIVDGPDLSDLRALLIQELGVSNALLCNSGSLALEIALRACDLRPGDEVVIPTFCCTSVVSPIVAIGAHPVLADVGEELNITSETLQPALTKKSRAIIVPHLFGNPADIESIINMARARNIRVIDDAAQALGANIAGRPAGTFGDAGILSFGSEKICFGLGGGVVVSSHQIVSRSLDVKMDAPQGFPALQNLSSTLLWRRWRRWSLPLQPVLYRGRATDPEMPPEAYRKELMSNLNAAVASTLMRTLYENIAARRARVQKYQILLGSQEGIILVPHQTGSACLTQVVRILPKVNGAERASDLIATLRSAGYEVQGSYIPIHLLAPYRQLAVRSLPRTEAIWADLIELPCEPEVSIEHAEQIASIVKQTLRSS
jgi:dTDP-4-amino-4,6-dideoxygalactose transaminase